MTVHPESDRDLYRELGVAPDVTSEGLRHAYRRLALELHPDVNSAPDAVDRFRTVARAYEVLSDSDRRADYDAARTAWAHAPDGDLPAQPPEPADVDYIPASDPLAHTDYVPPAPAGSWSPPLGPPRWAWQPGPPGGPPRRPAPRSPWPAGWPVGRIAPHRGLGPVLMAAWRLAPLPRTWPGKAATIAGVALVYWFAGPALVAALPPGPRPWAALLLQLLFWVALTCWTLRALTWISLGTAAAARRAVARAQRSPHGSSSPPRSDRPEEGY